MLCDKCKKNEAKIYYTEIINGEKKEQHLCEDCAMEYSSFQMGTPFMNQEITLGNLLSTILGNYYKENSHSGEQAEKELHCEECGNQRITPTNRNTNEKKLKSTNQINLKKKKNDN